MINLSIITVNYRGWKPLARCLDSLECLNEANFSSEIIVVDNASDDGQFTDFKLKYPDVHFVENSGNHGFANGNNVGADAAKGEFLLFLNPDTSASVEPLEEMLKTAAKHPDYSIISCKQVNDAGQDDKACGYFLSPTTISALSRALYRTFNKKELARTQCTNSGTIFPDWISGSLVLIKKEKFNQLGGWNEDYWIYYEDSDICKKAWEDGGKVAYLCNVTLLHSHGGVTRRNYKAKAFYKTEVMISRHVYIRNHFTGITRFLMHAYLVINNIFIEHLIPAIFGFLLFFIPSINVAFNKYVQLLKYYAGALWHQTWLSPRSVNYPANKTKDHAAL